MLPRCRVSPELVRHWPVVAASAVCLFFAFGVPASSLPFLYKSVIEEFHWSREQATMLGSIHWLSGAVVSLFVGKLVERMGAFRVILATAALSAVALMSFRFTSSTFEYYLTGIGLGLSGFGMVTSIQVFTSHLFTERQGAAIGLALVGNSLAGLSVPLFLAPALETYAWDDVMAVLGAVSLVVALPASLVFWTRQIASIEDERGGKRSAKTRSAFWTKRRFWLIAISLFLVAAVDGGLIQHTVLYLQVDKAIHYSIVGLAVSAYHLSSLVSRVVFGRFLDRFSVRGVMVGYTLVGLSALLALGVNGVVTAIVYTSCRGIAHGAVIVSSPILARHCFGREDLGRIIGVLVALTTIGFAVGAFALARLYELTESYMPGFVLFCLIPVIALLILRPVNSQHRRVESMPISK